MDRECIDELLENRCDAPTSSLVSPCFGASVLAQAKQVKAAILRHRQLLMISTLIAVALAVLITAQVGRSIELVPPPLDGFRKPSFSSPQLAP